MLIVSTQLVGMPIVSVHASAKIGATTRVIINPHNLTIAGFYVLRPARGEEEVLLPQDIRETDGKVFVINHEEDLADAEDLIRLEEVLKIDYQLHEKPVVTESGKKLGLVEDYVVDAQKLTIMSLHVSPTLLKSFMSSDRVISRKQILEVSEKEVTVKDATIKQTSSAPQAVPTT